MLGRMKKMRRIIVLLLVFLVLVLSGCSAADIKDNKSEKKDTKEAIESYERFVDVLSDFEYNIGSYNWNTDKKVAFSDIDKDGFEMCIRDRCSRIQRMHSRNRLCPWKRLLEQRLHVRSF